MRRPALDLGVPRLLTGWTLITVTLMMAAGVVWDDDSAALMAGAMLTMDALLLWVGRRVDRR